MTDMNPGYYQIVQAMVGVGDASNTYWPVFGGALLLASR